MNIYDLVISVVLKSSWTRSDQNST